MKKFVFVITAIFGLFSSLAPSYGEIINGVEINLPQEEIISVQDVGTAVVLPIPPGYKVVDFDDMPAPCLFDLAVAVRTEYETVGVTFEGQNLVDGGAVLDSCSGFSVTGFSGTNFLAFNKNALLQDGGTPTSPETLLFDQAVSDLQLNVGHALAGTVTVTAYDINNLVIGEDTLIGTSALQTLSLGTVTPTSIVKAEINFTGDILVVDDIAWSKSGSTTALLAISPSSGSLGLTQRFDMNVFLESKDSTMVDVTASINGEDLSSAFFSCFVPGTFIKEGQIAGQTFRCAGLRASSNHLGVGVHTIEVSFDLSDGTTVSDTAVWEVKENIEP